MDRRGVHPLTLRVTFAMASVDRTRGRSHHRVCHSSDKLREGDALAAVAERVGGDGGRQTRMGHLLWTAGTRPHRTRRDGARPAPPREIHMGQGGARFWGAQGGAQKGSDDSGMNPNNGACGVGALQGLEAQYFAAISDASPAFDMSCETSAEGGVPQYVSHNTRSIRSAVPTARPPAPPQHLRKKFDYQRPAPSLGRAVRAKRSHRRALCGSAVVHFELCLRGWNLLLTCPSFAVARSCTGNTCGECFAVQVRHR